MKIILLFLCSLTTVLWAREPNYDEAKVAAYLSCQAASKVWEFLGCEGFPSVAWPQPFETDAVGLNLGYYHRQGEHGISAYDWNLMLDFADKTLKRCGRDKPVIQG